MCWYPVHMRVLVCLMERVVIALERWLQERPLVEKMVPVRSQYTLSQNGNYLDHCLGIHRIWIPLGIKRLFFFYQRFVWPFFWSFHASIWCVVFIEHTQPREVPWHTLELQCPGKHRDNCVIMVRNVGRSWYFICPWYILYIMYLEYNCIYIYLFMQHIWMYQNVLMISHDCFHPQ